MLRKVSQRMRTILMASGCRPGALLTFLRHMPHYWRDIHTYQQMSTRGHRFPLLWHNVYPIVSDFNQPAGTGTGHYFYQDLWAAQKIYEAQPKKHIDIGSRVDGFVAHLLCFMPVEVVDIRALKSDVTGLTFVQEDATTMARFSNNSIESISSLHAIEHFGLGRYNDPIDPEGYYHAMRSLVRVLAVGGHLYFSVPIGQERVEFNAHRIFSPFTIVEIMHDLELVSFAAVDDQGDFVADARMDDFTSANFACGLFEFTKTNPTDK